MVEFRFLGFGGVWVLDKQRGDGRERERNFDEGGNGSLIRLFVVQWAAM